MLAEACSAAVRVLASGGSSTDAAVAATVVLEVNGFLNCGKTVAQHIKILCCEAEKPFSEQDSPITNAGLGSNLTEEGTVECDASLMVGDGTFGAVGACPGDFQVLVRWRQPCAVT